MGVPNSLLLFSSLMNEIKIKKNFIVCILYWILSMTMAGGYISLSNQDIFSLVVSSKCPPSTESKINYRGVLLYDYTSLRSCDCSETFKVYFCRGREGGREGERERCCKECPYPQYWGKQIICSPNIYWGVHKIVEDYALYHLVLKYIIFSTL